MEKPEARTRRPDSGPCRWLPLALALCLGPAGVLAQNPSPWLGQLSMADGLSQDVVYSITQDDKGFLWLGTAQGLNRYDGYGFKVFRHDPDDPKSLSHDKIRVVYVDRSGVLWIGTGDGGIDRFEHATETFTRLPLGQPDASSLGDIHAIYEDHQGTLWVGSKKGGLGRLDRASGAVTQYRHGPVHPSGRGPDQVRAILEDREGVLWIGTNDNGLGRLDPASGLFSYYVHDLEDPTSLSQGDVRALYEDREGMLWVGTHRDGLDRFDRASGIFTHYRHDPDDATSLSSNHVRAILEDRWGDLWIATHGAGLNRFDRRTGAFERLRSNPNDSRSLAHDDVRALFEDRSGVLWIGTYGGGLNRLDREASSFRLFAHDPTDAQSLSDNKVLALYEDRSGAVWLGTENGGLNRLDRDTGKFSRYRHDPDDPRSLRSNDVRAIYEDRAGTLWIGTNDGGLNRFDRATGSFIHHGRNRRIPGTIGNDDVRALFEDRGGNFWVGFNEGPLDLMDRATGSFRRADVPADPEQRKRGGVLALFEDAAGRLWIAFDRGGLLRIDRTSGESIAFRHDPDDPGSLSSDEVRAVHQDRAGTLWVGTRAGLDRFDAATQTFAHFKEQDGLPSDVVQAILEDERGWLWISTDAGLCRFDPSAESFRNHPVIYLGRPRTLHPGAALQTRDGEILLGGRSGLITFYPSDLEDREEPPDPALVFTSFEVVGEDVELERSITETRAIDLSYRAALVAFEVAMLDLKAPQRYRYAYRLEPLDEQWIELGQRREIIFSHLIPGNYTLRVRGWSIDRSVPQREIGLALRVAPPHWQTWWFRTTAAIAALALVTLVFQVRIRSVRAHNARLRAEQAKREELIEALEGQNAELERFTYTVSHDLKSPLVTIQGFLGLLREDIHSGDVEGVEEDMARISGAVLKMKRLLDDLLEMSRVGRVINPPEQVSLNELAAEAVSLVAGEIIERGVEVVTYADMPTVYVDRLRMLEVLQNLVHNAVKFMGQQSAPRVEIGAESNGEAVSCWVRDNGVGIEREYLEQVFGLFNRLDHEIDGTGIGLALAKRIVELHSGRIWVESEGPGRGSTFRFILPLDHAAVAEPAPDSQEAGRDA